jgi:hypothetical protein
MRLSLALLTGALAFHGAAVFAADPAVKCLTGKLKEAGKYGQCRVAAQTKALARGLTADYGKCVTKLTSKWQAIEAAAGGLCPSTEDVAAIEWRVQDHLANFEDLVLTDGGDASFGCAFLATGQTFSYGPADDGDVRAGGTLAYTHNGDGTITDLNTGLMWEKKIAPNGTPVNCADEAGSCADPHDVDNRYTWSASGLSYDGSMVTIFLEQLNNRCDADTAVACSANADCAAVGGSCGFAGHRDWRLPNLRELGSIVDYGRYNPAIDPAFNTGCGEPCSDIADPACSCTTPALHFSSSSVSQADIARTVEFQLGVNGGTFKDSYRSVRAVRN